jgi:hypothetical protein
MATQRRVIIPPLLLAAALLVATGCGSGDKCKKACKKVENCQKQKSSTDKSRDDNNSPDPYGGSSITWGCGELEKGECTPQAECQADCVLAATCDQILGNASTVMSCMVKCMSKSKPESDSSILTPIGQDSGPGCTPSCSGKQCGDDGCGGSCGTCSNGESCTFGVCVSSCTPSCSGKECGDDGCGGSCGTCSYGKTCNSWGQCESSQPSCTSSYCGSSSAVPGSSPSCYCDSQCKSNNDCCPGYDAVCGSSSSTNSGAICSASIPCSSSDTCLMLESAATNGMCLASCTNVGDSCATSSSGQLSLCALTDSAKTQSFCAYICLIQGQSYSCPYGTTCKATDPNRPDVKLCIPN